MLKKLADYGKERGKEVKIKRISLGDYAFVETENGNSGLAYIYKEWIIQRKNPKFPEKADEASSLLLSYNPLEISIGLATINALADRSGLLEGDALEFMNIPDGSKVALIGYFRPYVEKLKNRVKLFVFELKPVNDQLVYPWYAEEDLLPEMDYVIITGTTIVNKTINRILEISSDKKVAIVGPTTPLVPQAFEGLVNILAGLHITDNEPVYRMINGGNSIQNILRSPYVKKVVKRLL